jgi:hypothetical protein
LLLFFWLLVGGAAQAYQCIEQPFKERRLPHLSFTNASMVVVADTIEREYADIAKGSVQPRIDVLVHPDCANLAVTFDVKEVTVEGVLLILKKLYGVDWVQEENTIIITPNDKGAMTHRMYSVVPSMFPGCKPGGVCPRAAGCAAAEGDDDDTCWQASAG